eukprot:TRINITY_DN22423_c0_g1_i1.p1 TRINITY_DN22423_c0_g1~~TRINITY_DN22423_c0_g1_i1.p1  ORF type:complete len:398 (-),score=9.01 TRINITY_DN22423_c0_g1_i1:78-1271(-)
MVSQANGGIWGRVVCFYCAAYTVLGERIESSSNDPDQGAGVLPELKAPPVATPQVPRMVRVGSRVGRFAPVRGRGMLQARQQQTSHHGPDERWQMPRRSMDTFPIRQNPEPIHGHTHEVIDQFSTHNRASRPYQERDQFQGAFQTRDFRGENEDHVMQPTSRQFPEYGERRRTFSDERSVERYQLGRQVEEGGWTSPHQTRGFEISEEQTEQADGEYRRTAFQHDSSHEDGGFATQRYPSHDVQGMHSTREFFTSPRSVEERGFSQPSETHVFEGRDDGRDWGTYEGHNEFSQGDRRFRQYEGEGTHQWQPESSVVDSGEPPDGNHVPLRAAIGGYQGYRDFSQGQVSPHDENMPHGHYEPPRSYEPSHAETLTHEGHHVYWQAHDDDPGRSPFRRS